MNVFPLLHAAPWLLVVALSTALTIGIGLAGAWLADPDHPELLPASPECAADHLTYWVAVPGRPFGAGLRCVRIVESDVTEAAMRPGVPGYTRWIEVLRWTGEDRMPGSTSHHQGTAWLDPTKAPSLVAFVNIASKVDSISAQDSVVLDIEVVAGDWPRPSRFRVRRMWTEEWILASGQS